MLLFSIGFVRHIDALIIAKVCQSGREVALRVSVGSKVKQDEVIAILFYHDKHPDKESVHKVFTAIEVVDEFVEKTPLITNIIH